MKSLIKYLFLLSSILFVSCQMNELETAQMITREVERIKSEYAPNSCLAIFDVQIDKSQNGYDFNGWTDQPITIQKLEDFLNEQQIVFQNKIIVLPDSSVQDTPFAIVNNSVSNLRSNPKHSAELATQALLGTTLKMLRKTEEWYLVQAPDGYIAWVDHGGVVLVNYEQNKEWEQAAKVIFMKISGTIISSNHSDVIADIVLGAVTEKVDETSEDYLISMPDGRKGRLSKNDAIPLTVWQENLVSSGDLLEFYATQMLGFPYLWGGTSTKGMDCSGFTQTLYRMNGMVIPRDASQQIKSGIDVDSSLNRTNLKKGDLVFFGRSATDSTQQKVTHVGMWLGEQLFIHASQKVRLSSFDPNSPNYDEFNFNRYLGARRYLGASEFLIR